MSVTRVSTPIDIAVSGLHAQSLRMNVISDNIANASTTRTDNGQPYRRQDVVVNSTAGLGGVKFAQVAPDMSEFKRLYQPGHPHADKDGYVMMPNVDLPSEMVNMVTASRAYEANAAVMKRYEEVSDVAMELLR